MTLLPLSEANAGISKGKGGRGPRGLADGVPDVEFGPGTLDNPDVEYGGGDAGSPKSIKFPFAPSFEVENAIVNVVVLVSSAGTEALSMLQLRINRLIAREVFPNRKEQPTPRKWIGVPQL